MANLNKLFIDFNDKITISKNKSDNLKTSRNALRNDIKDWFSSAGKLQPKFCWQGSYAMNTLVNPLNGNDYDLDDGIYLQGFDDKEQEDWISTSTAHRWIKDAVDNRTKQDVVDKNTCVRVPYATGYHIDLPVYICSEEIAYLAHKDKGWIVSDPKAFRDWFINKVNENGEQLRRIVKYLKAWKDYNEVPLKGLEITILAANCFDGYLQRDDRCLANTVEEIIVVLEKKFECIKPVLPGEDLFEGISETKKNKILNSLKQLKDELEKANNESDEKTASEYVREVLGERFPLGAESTKAMFSASAMPGVLRRDGRSA